jgi:hypothetical protein
MKDLITAMAELFFGLIIFGIVFGAAMVALQYLFKGIWAYSVEIVVGGFLLWLWRASTKKSGK